MTKQRYTISLDEETIGEIERVSAKKGVPRSEIIEKYINRGLAKEVELTGLERMIHQDKVINLALDSILKVWNLEQKGGFVPKIDTILALLSHFSIDSPLRERKGVAEVSLFEVLNDLKNYDLPQFEEVMRKMSRYKRTKQMYLSLYPLWQEISSEENKE